MSDLESFLRPLDIMDSVTESNFGPEFPVLQMAPALLHGSVLNKLGQSILKCLEHGQNVRIGLASQNICDIPQDRSTLVVVASPFPALHGAHRHIR